MEAAMEAEKAELQREIKDLKEEISVLPEGHSDRTELQLQKTALHECLVELAKQKAIMMQWQSAAVAVAAAAAAAAAHAGGALPGAMGMQADVSTTGLLMTMIADLGLKIDAAQGREYINVPHASSCTSGSRAGGGAGPLQRGAQGPGSGPVTRAASARGAGGGRSRAVAAQPSNDEGESRDVDQGLLEAAQENAYAQAIMSVLNHPEMIEELGLKPGEKLAYTPVTAEQFAASFDFGFDRT